jgi:phage terminase large subunit-like protein
MKWLEALVLAGRLVHDGDPVLGWMVSKVVCHVDAKDNIYPRKERPENKIDGVVALIMAINRWMMREQVAPSVYETRGILNFDLSATDSTVTQPGNAPN